MIVSELYIFSIINALHREKNGCYKCYKCYNNEKQ